MTMTVSMDIKIKTKQNKHIFTWDFISTGIVLLFRFIVNNNFLLSAIFDFLKKKSWRILFWVSSQGLNVKIKNWPQFSFCKNQDW